MLNLYELMLDQGKALTILCLEAVLASFLLLSPSVYANVALSLVVVFIVPSISLTILFCRDRINIIEILFISMIVSSIFVSLITLLLSIIFPPLSQSLFIAVIVLLTALFLLVYVIRGKKVTITFIEGDLLSISIVFAAFFF